MKKLLVTILLITLSFTTNVFAQDVNEKLTLDDCKRIIQEVSDEFGVYLGLDTEEDEVTFFEYYKDYTEDELRKELEFTAEEALQLPTNIYINAPDDVINSIKRQRNYDDNKILFITTEVQEEYTERNNLKAAGYYTWITQRYTSYVDGPFDQYGSNPGRDYYFDCRFEAEIFIEGNERQYTGANGIGTESYSNRRHVRAFTTGKFYYDSYMTSVEYDMPVRYYTTVGLSIGGSTTVTAYFYL